MYSLLKITVLYLWYSSTAGGLESPESLLEMETLRLHPRSTEPETAF